MALAVMPCMSARKVKIGKPGAAHSPLFCSKLLNVTTYYYGTVPKNNIQPVRYDTRTLPHPTSVGSSLPEPNGNTRFCYQ